MDLPALEEIEWRKPFIDPLVDESLEAELKPELPPGPYPDYLRRVAYQPWLAKAELLCLRPSVAHMEPNLAGIAVFIACQQNSCRYCYGATRAVLQILGMDSAYIRRVERDVALTDERGRRIIAFVRRLTESDPRPKKDDAALLEGVGLTRQQLAELAAVVVGACLSNRVCTFLAVPPNARLERIGRSGAGRLIGWLFRRRIAASRPTGHRLEYEAGSDAFAPLVRTFDGTAYARWLRTTIDGCLAGGRLPRDVKLLMFGVVARSLHCSFSERAVRDELARDGWSNHEYDRTIESLRSERLSDTEVDMLRWTRETVWYVPAEIQSKTADLFEAVRDPALVVDAVGTVALANSVVRLAMLV